jgi:radical SAM superfamily enzyme YgiQ (UPF0313 family)
MRVLLLNPPSKELILKDYCCSEKSKANYYWPPIDLLVLSGILFKEHNVKVLDANATQLSFEESFKKVLNFKPDIIISLTSAISVKEDMNFLRKVKEGTDCTLLAIGDLAYFKPKLTMQLFPELDGIIFDFTSKEILKFLNGQKKNLFDLVLRENKNIKIFPKNLNRNVSYPIPRHELFPLDYYNLPFAKHKPISTVLSYTYGCSFNCTYCPSSMLIFRNRSVDDFIEELKYVSSLGIKEVFIRDFTFNTDRNKVEAICKKIIENNIDISWDCEARVDIADIELFKLMKMAGCNTIMFGVETANDNTQRNTKKYITREKIIDAFKACRKVGINTLGHFIIGLPGEKYEDMMNTIKFSKIIGCDYAAFNLYAPRLGTSMRECLINEKKIKTNDLSTLDCSSEVMAINSIEKEKILKLHKKALIEFYLRPSYIIKLLLKTRTITQFNNMLQNGIIVIKNIISK